MHTQKQKGKAGFASIIITAAAAIVALTASCGGKPVQQKPDHEPGLRENKAHMMNKMDTTINKR